MYVAPLIIFTYATWRPERDLDGHSNGQSNGVCSLFPSVRMYTVYLLLFYISSSRIRLAQAGARTLA
jgi:hypothetical protein